MLLLSLYVQKFIPLRRIFLLFIFTIATLLLTQNQAAIVALCMYVCYAWGTILKNGTQPEERRRYKSIVDVCPTIVAIAA